MDMPFFMVRAGRELFYHETGRDLDQQRHSDSSSLIAALQSDMAGKPTMPGLGNEAAHKEEYPLLKPRESFSTPSTDPRHSYGMSTVASPVSLDFSSSTSSTLSSLTIPSTLSGMELSPVHTAHCPGQIYYRPVPIPASQQALTHCSLAVNVALSKASFVRSSDAVAKPQDICISIFFNGEFTDSRIVSNRVLSGTPDPLELSHVFSGRRVDRTSERRWVLVPSGQNPDGSLRSSRRTKLASTTAGERWASIGKALEEEAEQWGKSEQGERSTVSEYLAGLAKVQMPADIELIQTATGQKYGVVDVVITLGRAKKNPPSDQYLRAPRRALDLRFTNKKEQDTRNWQPKDAGTDGSKPGRLLTDSTKHNPTAKSSSSQLSPRVNQGPPNGRGRDSPKSVPKTPIRKLAALKPRTKVRPEDKFPTTLSQTMTLSGRAGSKFDLELIPASGGPAAWSPKPTTTSLSVTPDIKGSSAGVGSSREGQRALNMNKAPGGASNYPAPSGPTHPLPIGSPAAAGADGAGQDSPSSKPAEKQNWDETRTPSRRMRPPNLSGLGLQGSSWTPSVLCSDSFITYAEDEGWKRGARYGDANPMYRVCRSERGATMETSGVLMGVRFVVG